MYSFKKLINILNYKNDLRPTNLNSILTDMMPNILFKPHTAESTYANAKLNLSTLIVLVNSNIIVFLNDSSYYYEAFIIYSILPL